MQKIKIQTDIILIFAYLYVIKFNMLSKSEVKAILNIDNNKGNKMNDEMFPTK